MPRRGGEKRKADEDPAGELERARREETDQEIPIPESTPMEVTSAPTQGMNSTDSGSTLKRPLEDTAEERERHRARLEALCALCHGRLDEAPDVDLQSLIAAANSDPYSSESASWLEAETAGSEWLQPWWTQESKPDVESELGASRVNEAKRKEIESFQERGVYEVVDRREAGSNPHAIKLSTKWVITNKGTKAQPIAKARLVAREFVSDRIDRDTLFAGTPGLSSMKLLLSRAATRLVHRVARARSPQQRS